jgi:hypothetical protein
VKTTQAERYHLRLWAEAARSCASKTAEQTLRLLDDLDELRECLRIAKAAADGVRVTPWTVEDEHRICAALKEPS